MIVDLTNTVKRMLISALQKANGFLTVRIDASRNTASDAATIKLGETRIL